MSRWILAALVVVLVGASSPAVGAPPFESWRQLEAGDGPSLDMLERCHGLEIIRSQLIKLERILNKSIEHGRVRIIHVKASHQTHVADCREALDRARYAQCITDPQATCRPPSTSLTRALSTYEKVLEEYPNYTRTDEVLFDYGRILARSERLLEAQAVFKRLVNGFPKSRWLIEAHFELGENALERGLVDEAAFHYRASLQYEWKYAPRARFRLAQIARDKDDSNTAAEQLGDVLAGRMVPDWLKRLSEGLLVDVWVEDGSLQPY